MIKAKETVFRWPLDDFEDRFANTTVYQSWHSDDFEVEGVPKAKFGVVFFPKGVIEKDREAHIYLCIRDLAGHPSVRLKFEGWFENGEGEQLKHNETEKKFYSRDDWGWGQVCPQASLLDLAESRPLVACCKITPLDPMDAVEWAQKAAPLDVLGKLAANFDSEEFADVEVHVQERVFKVSKVVICSGSPVFRGMFTTATKERETGVVEIKKEEPEVIELLLRFLYSGQVSGLKEVAHRLLPVADCYEVLRLAGMCLESLLAHVSVETILRDLKLAFAHDHEGDFKRKLVEFAHQNFKLVKQQAEWTPAFFLENPEIAFEVTALCTC